MKTLGKYEVLEELGAGAMGKVFHGRDRVLQREVAIKTISTEDADVELKQRFYREARSCGRLSHPNIVTVFDLGEQQGTSYIAMEYLEGQDLRKFIDGKTFMPLEGKIQIMAEVADGLAHAHDSRIVHRDIKPSNIFLLKSGRPKLLDFGIARVFASQLTRVGNAIGTPEYMAPEQIRGKEADARSDIFSAAVVFFELLTHEHPFGETDIPRKIVQDTPKSLRALNPFIPEKLDHILMKAMAKEPDQRYQTAAEFAKALRKIGFEIMGTCSKLTEETLANRKRILDSLVALAESSEPEWLQKKLAEEKIDVGVTGKITPEMAMTTNANLHYFSLSALSQEMARTADAMSRIAEAQRRKSQEVAAAPKPVPGDQPTTGSQSTIATPSPQTNPELQAVRKRIAALFDEDVNKCLAEIEILPPALANDSVIDSFLVRALSARNAQQSDAAERKAPAPAPAPAPRPPVPEDRPTVVAVGPEPVVQTTLPRQANTKLIGGIAAAAVLLIVLLVYNFSSRNPKPEQIATPAAPAGVIPEVKPTPAASTPAATEPAPPPQSQPPAAEAKAPAKKAKADVPPNAPPKAAAPRSGPKPETAPPPAPAVDWSKDLADARAAFVAEKYDAAIGLCDKILAVEPTNAQASELRRRALNAKKLEEQLTGH